VQISVDEPAEAERIFHAGRKRQVKMPIEQTFWSVRFGWSISLARRGW